MNDKIKITVGDNTFVATLENNPSANAFKVLLPITLEMNELNSNEKYADLPTHLPTNSSTPPKIQSGDLMLYGSDVLVLFYKTFSTSYRYTKIGTLDNVEGLFAALGAGDVQVVFELL